MMNDLIYRQSAINALENTECELLPEEWDELTDAIKQVPPAEPKKGRWIRNDNGTYSCSVCQSWIPEEQHHYARYCLYCGTKMEVRE